MLIGVSSILWMMLDAKSLPASKRRPSSSSFNGINLRSLLLNSIQDKDHQMMPRAMMMMPSFVYYHVVSPYYNNNNPFHPMDSSSKWSTFASIDSSSSEEEEAQESKTIEEIKTSETEEEESTIELTTSKEQDETITEETKTVDEEIQIITTETPITDDAAENSTIESQPAEPTTAVILEDKARKTFGRPTSTTYVCILGKCQHTMEAKQKLEQQIEAELWAKL